MNSFIGRLKQGATEAGKKAQITVEVNRLRLQISSKEKEITTIYARIGESYYQAVQNNELEQVQGELQEYCDLINHKKAEIAEIEDKIRVLRNEKICPSCGNATTLDTKFCSKCGHEFAEEEAEAEADDDSEAEEEKVTCPSCQAEMEKDAIFCGECGHKVEGQEA